MRKFGELGYLRYVQPPEVLSVLRLHAVDEPLFPNLKTLDLWVDDDCIPFIPLFLSQRTAIIRIGNLKYSSSKAIVASMITTFPTRCPNLNEISLSSLPRDPMITAAVSRMLLASDRSALRSVCVDSPLTEEARQMVCKLPNLRSLSMVIEKGSSLPSVELPSLTNLMIKFEHDSDWMWAFHGANFGKLAAVTFHSGYQQIGDFLESFERAALTTSVQDTLSEFRLHTSCSWYPNYLSLLPFTQLMVLVIQFSCIDGCSSTVGDDVITNLAGAMPKLEILQLGEDPCREINAGVTAKGLMILAHHCTDLRRLRIHFQVDSLRDLPAISGVTSGTKSNAPRKDCALTDLEVGEIPMLNESVSAVALTLAHIFPCMEGVECVDENWYKVMEAICVSREIIDRLGEEHRPFCTPE